ncbi:hypothetical protein H8D57_03370 [bacterium]|nr:hypothetical protein [bacterium]
MYSIEEICNNLSCWFEEQEYIGYDPYQLNRYRWIIAKRLQKPKLATLFLQKLIIPKALGLIIRGNVNLYLRSKKPDVLSQNEKIIRILLNNSYNSGYQNSAWGWPFSWTSGFGLIYPEGYPLSVVTAEIGHAFLDHYEVKPSEELKAICGKVADALINEIGFTKINNEEICFHYTNLDKYFVINTNTYVASYLARLHSIQPKKEYYDLSSRACKFTLTYQQDDGSWYYYAPPFVQKNKTIDNRHTGFTIVALQWANKFLKDKSINEAISKGWEFYRKNFVSDYKPKNSLNSIFPIDIHNVAQLIITATECGDKKLAEGCAQWAIESMSNKKDEFYYQMYQDGTIIKIPFFRWNQAWMYRALTLFQERWENEKSNGTKQ